jgi:hypothetical protein
VDTALSPEAIRQPSAISTLAASPKTDLLLSADLDGFIHVLTEDYEIKTSWRAYGSEKSGGGGRCTHIVIAQSEKWKGIIITLGVSPLSPFILRSYTHSYKYNLSLRRRRDLNIQS